MTLRDPGDFSSISPDSGPAGHTVQDGKPIGPSDRVGIAGGEPANGLAKTVDQVPEEPDESVEPGLDEQPDPAGLSAPEPDGGASRELPEPPGEAGLPDGPLNRAVPVAKRSVKMIKVERDPDPPYWVTVYRWEPGSGNAGYVWMRSG